MIKEAKDDVRRDMDDLKRSLEEQDRINQEKKIKQDMARTGLQGDVLMQVGEKERLKKRTYQEEMYELRAEKLANMSYQKRIDDEKTMNVTLLNEMKRRPAPF